MWGKTLASCALLHALAGHHSRVVGMKAVAAGAEPDGQWGLGQRRHGSPACCLHAGRAGSAGQPVLLPDPHVAAYRGPARGRGGDFGADSGRFRQLTAQADAVVVEGAGGWRVPLSETLCIADLAVALQLPVVLVVGLKLGCLNHAVLTAEAIRAAGLPLAGWVAAVWSRRCWCPRKTWTGCATQLGRLGAPLLADIPWQATPDPRLTSFSLPKEWQ